MKIPLLHLAYRTPDHPVWAGSLLPVSALTPRYTHTPLTHRVLLCLSPLPIPAIPGMTPRCPFPYSADKMKLISQGQIQKSGAQWFHQSLFSPTQISHHLLCVRCHILWALVHADLPVSPPALWAQAQTLAYQSSCYPWYLAHNRTHTCLQDKWVGHRLGLVSMMLGINGFPDQPFSDATECYNFT